MVTTRTRVAKEAPASRRTPSITARWLIALGAQLLTYPLAYGALAGLNAVWWRYGSPIDQHLPWALGAGVVGLAGIGAGRALLKARASRGLATSASRHVLVSGLSLVLGVAAAVYGQSLLWGAVWFDLTFDEAGRVGASFSFLATFMAMFIVLPMAGLLLAIAWELFPGRSARRIRA